MSIIILENRLETLSILSLQPGGISFELSLQLGGMTEIGCDSIDKLKSKLHSLDMEILDPNKFKENQPFR